MNVVRQAVGADHGVLVGKDGAHVTFVELEIDGSGRQQSLGRCAGAATPFFGNLVEHPAG